MMHEACMSNSEEFDSELVGKELEAAAAAGQEEGADFLDSAATCCWY